MPMLASALPTMLPPCRRWCWRTLRSWSRHAPGIIEQRFEIEALKSRLAKLLRMTFGRSSEKLRDQVEQLELTLADIDEMLAEIAPARRARCSAG